MLRIGLAKSVILGRKYELRASLRIRLAMSVILGRKYELRARVRITPVKYRKKRTSERPKYLKIKKMEVLKYIAGTFFVIDSQF